MAACEAVLEGAAGPILVTAPMLLRAKAIRYGYKESEETRVEFTK